MGLSRCFASELVLAARLCVAPSPPRSRPDSRSDAPEPAKSKSDQLVTQCRVLASAATPGEEKETGRVSACSSFGSAELCVGFEGNLHRWWVPVV